MNKYSQMLAQLPELAHEAQVSVTINSGVVEIGQRTDLSTSQHELLHSLCKDLIPWRKGPFNLFDIFIDAEWRSDKKWERIAGHLPTICDKAVLDIGCNNGHYLFQMAQQHPRLLLGIDPFPLYQAQFTLLNKYAKLPNTSFEAWGIEHLKNFKEKFDLIFSMGIIYHHRHPIAQLEDINRALQPGGVAIIESIGIPGEAPHALFPPDRYANMRNVWFIPTLSCLINWAHKAKFKEIEVISDSLLTNEEQRTTAWCPPPFQSLDDFLNPQDRSLTIEGFPAPRRFALKVKRRI